MAIRSILVFLCVIGMLAYVAESRKARKGQAGRAMGGDDSGSASSDRVWTFAIGDGQNNEAYIDEVEGTLKGFLVDLVNCVCEIADKNCRIIGDLWTRCWDSVPGEASRGGVGLMGYWYDACPGWVGTFDRHRTFQFTDPYGNAEVESLFVKKGTPRAGWQDLTGKNVGILDGYASDEHCLARSDQLTGVPLDENQIFHYDTPSKLVDAVNNGEIDIAFALPSTIPAGALKPTDAQIPCSSSGPALMHRVDNELPSWWNPAMEQLLSSDKYEEICQDLTEEHGHQPGRDPDEVCLVPGEGTTISN